jgi:hypothetical protein
MKLLVISVTALLFGIALANAQPIQERPGTQPQIGIATRIVTIEVPPQYSDSTQNIGPYEFGNKFLGPFQRTFYRQGSGYPMQFNIGDIVYSIEEASANLHMELRITVTAPDDKCNGAADKAVEYVKSVLDDAVQAARDNMSATLATLDRRLHDLREQRDAVSSQLATLRDDISRVGLADASTDNIRSMARDLDGQLESLTIDIAGKTARQKALADAIAKLSNQMDATVTNDPIAQQLQTVVDIKEKDLEMARKAQAAAAISNSELNRAMAELAQDKANLLERKETAAKAAGADSLNEWNHDLLVISVDLAELNAKAEVVKSRIASLRDVLEAMTELPPQSELQKKLDDLEDKAADLTAQYRAVKSPLDDPHRPTFAVQKSYERQPNN